MSIRERFMVGLYLSSSSFWLLWLHKKLLVYLSFLLVVFYFVPLIFHNSTFFKLAANESLSYNVAFELGFFAYIFLLNFLLIALIKHTMAIIHGNGSISVRAVVKDTASLWPQIFGWSLLFSIVLCLIRGMLLWSARFSSILAWVINFKALVLFVAWMLLTFLVLPVIAVEKKGVIGAIKKSFKLVCHVYVEMIAAICWIGIIGGLGLMVIVMLMHVMGNQYMGFILSLVTIFCYYLIHSAVGVAQALLYQRSIQVS